MSLKQKEAVVNIEKTRILCRMSAIAWLTVISLTANETHTADFCLSKSVNAELQLTHWQDEDILQMGSVRASEPWLVYRTESLYTDIGSAQNRGHQRCMFPHLCASVCWDTLVKVFEILTMMRFFFLCSESYWNSISSLCNSLLTESALVMRSWENTLSSHASYHSP